MYGTFSLPQNAIIFVFTYFRSEHFRLQQEVLCHPEGELTTVSTQVDLEKEICRKLFASLIVQATNVRSNLLV